MLSVLNTTIITSDGLYDLRTITTEEAIELINSNEFQSCVGHESTAEILTEILGVSIESNRVGWFPEKGDMGLCFKLNSRPKEGVILTRNELEEIGFTFKVINRIK